MALVAPGGWTLTSEVDVRVTGGPAGLPSKFPPALALHIGSARVPVKLRILGPVRLGEGDDGELAYARLALREPLPLHAGDRVLLRDPGAADLAIYGATVLDTFPPQLGRRGAVVAAARELASWPDMPRAADLLRRHGLLRSGDLAAAGVGGGAPATVAGDWLADAALWTRLRAELPRAVTAFLARDPLARGMPVEAARGALGLPARDLVAALLASPGSPASGVVLDGGYLRMSQAPPSLPPKLASAVQSVRDDLAKDPFVAPDAQRLRELGLDAKALAAAARAGLLLRVADHLVLAPDAAMVAAQALAELPQPFTTSQARQALRTTRRVVIPLLEYLDRARITQRLPGDLRQLRPR
jgi:selenocysteine-specific elongation factor